MNISEIIQQNFFKISNEYSDFLKKKSACRSCEIYNDYQHMVFSEGNAQNPTFMVVAQSPGRKEIELDRPLIGPAGQELRKNLRECGFNKKNTILTNVLPCRPKDNKFPADWSIAAHCCANWLSAEIKILRPKIIILCGAEALKAVMNNSGVGANRGRWKFNYPFQAWIIATWHPSYVIRCQRSGDKQPPLQFKSDIEKVSTEWEFLISNSKVNLPPDKYNDKVVEELLSEYKFNTDDCEMND